MTMSSTTKKALIYCRVSSERQKTEGHGLDSQEQRCRLYCEQKGYEVEKVFKDSFTGGGDFMRRPKMKELLEYVDAHPHKNYVTVFDDLKRFARDTVFHLKLRQSFKVRGMTPECPNFNFDDSPEGEFVETIFAAQGQLEREQNRRQVIQKQKARLELGYWPFYPIPGYRQIKTSGHGKLLTPYEPEAEIIRTALEGFATDQFWTQGDVQRYLEERNYGGKKKIHFQLANRLFARVFMYAGFVGYAPWEVSQRMGHHKPLIDLITYEKIRNKLDSNAPVRTRKDMREDFPLRHTVIVCGQCGRPFTASYTTKKKKPGYKKAYYRCNNLACELRKKSVAREVIEGQFETLLRGIEPKPFVLKLSEAIFFDLWEKRMANFTENNAENVKELARVQSEIHKLVGMATRAASERVKVEYEKQIDELAKTERDLHAKTDPANRSKIDFRTALRRVFDYLKDPYYRWKNGDLIEKQLVLKLVFEDVLPYDLETGFRTAPLALPLRVFEHFTTSKSRDVEAGGIEPPCKDNADGPSTSVV